MIAAIDNHYFESHVRSAACCFRNWQDDLAVGIFVAIDEAPHGYVPGQFYRRELPGILKLLRRIDVTIETLVVDGYVDLAKHRPGLGRHLYNALNQSIPVIGVAKNPFAGCDMHVELLRGASSKPLYVTACGLDLQVAYSHIQSMAGDHRIPSMLKRADRLARTGQ